MDKILILDKDESFVQALKSDLNKMNQFEVSTVTLGENAIEHFQKKKVSVFITDINVSDMDALDILSYMSKKHPNTPCIVMTDHKKPWFKERMAQQSFLYHLEKPFKTGALANAIFVGLNLRDEGIHLNGMTMASVLPLVEMLQKTCRIKVSSKGQGTGYLYFNEGILVDAHFKDLRHDKAAAELSKWNNIIITLSDLPLWRKRTRVKTQLMELAGASWDKYEPGNNHAVGSPDSVFGIEQADFPLIELESIDDIFDKHINKFSSIKGYVALAIIGKDGEILADDLTDNKINFDRIIKESLHILSIAQDSTDFIGFKPCNAITVHTQKGIIIMLPAASGSDPNVNVIGLTSPDGDWVAMKMHLGELLSELNASSASMT